MRSGNICKRSTDLPDLRRTMQKAWVTPGFVVQTGDRDERRFLGVGVRWP